MGALCSIVQGYHSTKLCTRFTWSSLLQGICIFAFLFLYVRCPTLDCLDNCKFSRLPVLSEWSRLYEQPTPTTPLVDRSCSCIMSKWPALTVPEVGRCFLQWYHNLYTVYSWLAAVRWLPNASDFPNHMKVWGWVQSKMEWSKEDALPNAEWMLTSLSTYFASALLDRRLPLSRRSVGDHAAHNQPGV